MAFEMCTCSWKANVYTPIFLLFSTKKALYYSQNRDPKVLQCIYHILDSGHGTYVKKSFPITYYPILCTYFFVAMETGVSNSVLITALKSRSTILDKVSKNIHRNSQIFCNSNNIGSAHTSYLSRTRGRRPCKYFLAGVNFYRFNAKNWHFRQILREKVAFFYRFNAKNWRFSV